MHLSTLLLPLTFALVVAGGQTWLPFHPPSKSPSTTTQTVPVGPIRNPIHYTYPDHPTIILPRGEIPRPTPVDQFVRPGAGAGRFGGSFVEKHNEPEPHSYSEIITWAPSTTGQLTSLPTSIVIDTSSYSHGSGTSTSTPSQTLSVPGTQSTPASHSTSGTHSASATQSAPASHSTSITQGPSPSTSHSPFTNSTTVVTSIHSLPPSFTTSTTIVPPSPTTSSATRPSSTTVASASPTSSGSTLKWDWTLLVCGFMGVFVFGML